MYNPVLLLLGILLSMTGPARSYLVQVRVALEFTADIWTVMVYVVM